MSLIVFALAIVAPMFLLNKPASAKTLGSGDVKEVAHFLCDSGQSSKGVGTNVLLSKCNGDNEVQGMTLTPNHIVITAYEHYDSSSSHIHERSRVYFIDRSTKKIVKVIPDKSYSALRDQRCNRDNVGKTEGCWGHVSTAGYNSKTGKIYVTTQAGAFVFDDKTMKYEKGMGYRGKDAKYNAAGDFFWFSEERKIYNGDLSNKKGENYGAHRLSGQDYWEGNATWKNYLMSNSWFDGDKTVLSFVDYKKNKTEPVKTVVVKKGLLSTELIEGCEFGSDGTLYMMTPAKNSGGGWGHGAKIYAVSAKTLGIGSSTNMKLGKGSDATSGGNSGSSNAEPHVDLAPQKEYKCATILSFWCKDAESNGDTTIRTIIEFVATTMTIGIVVLGTIGLILCGYTIMTARDDEAKIAKAKKRIIEIVIGLILWTLIDLIVSLFII